MIEFADDTEIAESDMIEALFSDERMQLLEDEFDREYFTRESIKATDSVVTCSDNVQLSFFWDIHLKI